MPNPNFGTRGEQPPLVAPLRPLLPPLFSHGWASPLSMLLTDDVLGNDDHARQVPTGPESDGASVVTSMRAVADYVCDLWKLRNTALTGRGTNEGNLMV